MNDALLSVQDQEEELSFAYVAAVAAKAGYGVAKSNKDRDGTDMKIEGGSKNEGVGKDWPSIGIQLKATVNLGQARGGCFRFRLKQENYKKLRVETLIPRLLVVLDLPKNAEQWLEITPDALILRRAAYWMSLRGFPNTSNKTSTTIKIPEENLFDVSGLCALMERARKGCL